MLCHCSVGLESPGNMGLFVRSLVWDFFSFVFFLFPTRHNRLGRGTPIIISLYLRPLCVCRIYVQLFGSIFCECVLPVE